MNPCRQIRHQAFVSLQNSLLSPDLASPDHQEWTAIFSEVLFPLISRLLRPEVYQTDPVGMSETRVQASRLLCNIFLHYLALLSEWDGMLDLWLRILDVMDRLMNSGQGDNLEEAVPESLKNILLVMVDGGFLSPPKPTDKPSELWIETCRKVDRFLPGLVADLFPQAAAVPIQSPTRTLMQETITTPQPKNQVTSEDEPENRSTEKAKQPSIETVAEDVE